MRPQADLIIGFVAATLLMCVVACMDSRRQPVEIDPTARIYTIKLAVPHPDYYHIKDPVFHQNGGVTFKNRDGKEVIFGPAVQWVATQE